MLRNESSVDLTVCLMHAGSVRTLGRVDRFGSRTFRVSHSSVAGPRIELRALDESLHITPPQVLAVANQKTPGTRAEAAVVGELVRLHGFVERARRREWDARR